MKVQDHIKKTMEVFAPFNNEDEELKLWLLVHMLQGYMDMYAREINGLAHRAKTHHEKGIEDIIGCLIYAGDLQKVDTDLARLILRLHIWQDAQYGGVPEYKFKIPQDERTWNIYV